MPYLFSDVTYAAIAMRWGPLYGAVPFDHQVHSSVARSMHGCFGYRLFASDPSIGRRLHFIAHGCPQLKSDGSECFPAPFCPAPIFTTSLLASEDQPAHDDLEDMYWSVSNLSDSGIRSSHLLFLAGARANC